LEIPEASIPETPDFIKDALKAATMSLTVFEVYRPFGLGA
jgi:hypothetical protein